MKGCGDDPGISFAKHSWISAELSLNDTFPFCCLGKEQQLTPSLQENIDRGASHLGHCCSEWATDQKREPAELGHQNSETLGFVPSFSRYYLLRITVVKV